MSPVLLSPSKHWHRYWCGWGGTKTDIHCQHGVCYPPTKLSIFLCPCRKLDLVQITCLMKNYSRENVCVRVCVYCDYERERWGHRERMQTHYCVQIMCGSPKETEHRYSCLCSHKETLVVSEKILEIHLFLSAVNPRPFSPRH